MLSLGELKHKDKNGSEVPLPLHCRGKKTKNNRKFRKHVLGCTATDPSSVPSEVTWLDCQEAIISLQLQTGCTVRLCKGPEELAQYVFSLTKAISEKPFRLALTCLTVLARKLLFSLPEKKVPFLSIRMQLVEIRKRYLFSYLTCIVSEGVPPLTGGFR